LLSKNNKIETFKYIMLNNKPQFKTLGMTKNSSELLQEFIERSCDELRVRQSDLFSPSREADVAHLRHAVMNLINKRLRVTKTDIGKMFNRDHSTVVHAVYKTTTMKRGSHFSFIYRTVEPIWKDVFSGTLFEDDIVLEEQDAVQVQQEVDELSGVLTTSEVARILRVNPTMVTKMVKRGDIKCFKVGKRRRFKASEIKKFMSV
jgi:excisionase family DNA binding protein